MVIFTSDNTKNFNLYKSVVNVMITHVHVQTRYTALTLLKLAICNWGNFNPTGNDCKALNKLSILFYAGLQNCIIF